MAAREGHDHPSSTCLRWQFRPPIRRLVGPLSSGLVKASPTISMHSLAKMENEEKAKWSFTLFFFLFL